MPAGNWHPSMYRSAPNMSAISLDWGDQGPGGQSEQNTAFIGNGNGLAATVMQERQASYMYIMPQEHLSSKDSPEVCVCVCMQSAAGAPSKGAWILHRAVCCTAGILCRSPLRKVVYLQYQQCVAYSNLLIYLCPCPAHDVDITITPAVQQVLICGWREEAFMSDMLREMDHGPSALPAGSQLTLFNSSANAETMARVKTRNR